MIPAHLMRYHWYAAHQAWLAAERRPHHTPPEGTAPMRADLRRANLTGADLTWAILTDADLTRADLADTRLTGADLRGASLRGANLTVACLADANLYGADLTDARLTGADLIGAELYGANLTGADLTDADPACADLTGARGIVALGPVGDRSRMIYGVQHADRVMIQAGCAWATLDDIRAAVAERYADGSGREHHRAGYLAALDAIAAIFGGQA